MDAEALPPAPSLHEESSAVRLQAVIRGSQARKEHAALVKYVCRWILVRTLHEATVSGVHPLTRVLLRTTILAFGISLDLDTNILTNIDCPLFSPLPHLPPRRYARRLQSVWRGHSFRHATHNKWSWVGMGLEELASSASASSASASSASVAFGEKEGEEKEVVDDSDNDDTSEGVTRGARGGGKGGGGPQMVSASLGGGGGGGGTISLALVRLLHTASRRSQPWPRPYTHGLALP